METINRLLPVAIQPIPGNDKYLDKIGIDEEGKNAVALWRGLPAYQKLTLAQDVLNVIGQRHNLELTLKSNDNDILATDKKRTTYYLVGSWWDCRFVCRGLLKVRKNAMRVCYSFNGQASTGTIQVAHYGEQLQIRYPQIQEIIDKLYFMKKGVKHA